MVDYYAVLGVNPTAEDIVIRAAFKALAQRYHPDRFAGSKDEAHRRMSELTEAYEVLADPLRRPKYDRRRSVYTRSVAARLGTSRKFAAQALDLAALRRAGAMRGRYRVALVTLMAVVVVLSAFNLVHYSARIKGWFSPRTATTPILPISQGDAPFVETARPVAQASPREDAVAAPAVITPADTQSIKEKKRSATRNAAASRPARTAPVVAAAEPCRDVVAALGLCSPDKPAKGR